MSLGFIATVCNAVVAGKFDKVEAAALSSIEEAETADVCIVKNEADALRLKPCSVVACLVAQPLVSLLPAGIIPLVVDDPVNAANVLSFVV